MNAADGGWTQQYQSKTFHQFNPYKGNENPNSKNLGLAAKQLQNNPLSHALLSENPFHSVPHPKTLTGTLNSLFVSSSNKPCDLLAYVTISYDI